MPLIRTYVILGSVFEPQPEQPKWAKELKPVVPKGIQAWPHQKRNKLLTTHRTNMMTLPAWSGSPQHIALPHNLVRTGAGSRQQDSWLAGGFWKVFEVSWCDTWSLDLKGVDNLKRSLRKTWNIMMRNSDMICMQNHLKFKWFKCSHDLHAKSLKT